LTLCFLATSQFADRLTEVLLYFLIIFTPWAFGTTQPWSISVLNTCGYLMGALLLIKSINRRFWNARGKREGGRVECGKSSAQPKGWTKRLTPTRLLAVLTILILGYCLLSAVNARATYDSAQLQLHYHSCLMWLPHSYESQSTWSAFWHYLALALVFWATRDWLLNGVQSEATPAAEEEDRNRISRSTSRLPRRLHRLLWLLCLNGALLGMEGILQRIDGGGKLLWLVEPEIHKDAQSQFGPYAYRSNAAQYFVLLWPVCLGFWWLLNRTPTRMGGVEGERRARAYGVLLPCAMLMLACAIASLSRAGALVALGQIGAAWLILLIGTRRRNRQLLLGISALLLAAMALAGYFEWEALTNRFGDAFHDRMGGRAEIYEHARRMARDFAVLGSGPKTFSPLYQFYFSTPEQYWAAQVHNDWLETWITFGGVGMGLILLALAQIFCRYFGRGGTSVAWPFVAFIWVGLLGCLVYGAADFPFQVPSILFLFLLLCSIAFTCSRGTRNGHRQGEAAAT